MRTLNNCVDDSLIDENVVSFRDIQDKLVNIYAKKNHDYGDSFNEGCNELGVGYAFSRIFDKTKRFQTLAKGIMNNNLSIEVQDETIEDTIMDLANYCMMYLAWRDKHVCVRESESKQCDMQVSSTGGLKSNKKPIDIIEPVEEYHKIGAELNNAISKLMAKYQIIRVYHHSDYAYVEADSEEEAKKKAIEDNIWEENPNNILLGYEYIAIKDNKVII